MAETADVVVIGGGIAGAAAGYYLAKAGRKVLLLEKSFLASGSTGRCIGGIRQQFSTETTILTMLESVRLFKSMADEFGMDVEWRPSGYLFLAHTREQAALYEKNISIQKPFGLDVSFIQADECKRLVPHLNTEGLIGGAWGPTDGQANPFLVVHGYARGIRRLGGKVETGEEVVAIDVGRNRVKAVRTASGRTVFAGMVLNAAGAWAREVGAMAGIDLPVEPERHEALVTEGVQYLGVPMLVDYRPDGGYFVQRVTGQFIGCFTPKQKVAGHSHDSTIEFLADMSWRMVRLMPSLKDVHILRQWAGSYSMSPDGIPMVGRTSVEGVYCIVGLCGHGFMLGPALGKMTAQFMTEGSWPIPLGEFACGRSFGEKEKMA
jgi:sarcosine oxidase, subunit beta